VRPNAWHFGGGPGASDLHSTSAQNPYLPNARAEKGRMVPLPGERRSSRRRTPSGILIYRHRLIAHRTIVDQFRGGEKECIAKGTASAREKPALCGETAPRATGTRGSGRRLRRKRDGLTVRWVDRGHLIVGGNGLSKPLNPEESSSPDVTERNRRVGGVGQTPPDEVFQSGMSSHVSGWRDRTERGGRG